jgi:iron complex outermembrane receptor protein
MRIFARGLFTTSAMVATLAVAPTPALAQAQTFDFNIPAQPLDSSLRAFARASHQQIMFDRELVRGKTSPALKGTYSADAAVALLLEGSGLAAKRTNGGSWVVSSSTGTPQGNALAGAPNAGTESASSSSGEVTEPAAAGAGAKIEEIIVVGSRLGARNGDKGAAPVTSFDRQAIEKLGVTNVADVFNYLPQQSFSVSEGINFAGARVVRLRGLGLGNTLVLINGRRVITSALQGAGNVFDLNTIPITAVERIDVLADSASAVYGADAVGGVVNVILKSRVGTPELDLYYGSADGGGDEKSAALSAGIAKGRFRANVTLDYFKRDFLLGTERDIYANSDFRRFGGNDARSIISNPGNISSTTAANLPGLPSRTAAVPVGSTGVGLTPADFLATAGRQNLENLGQFRSVLPKAERFGAVGWLEADITSNVTLFGEFLYSKRREVSQTVPAFLISRTVPAANPFNPFGAPVAVTYLFEGLGPQRIPNRSELTRYVVGGRGELGNWQWEANVLHSGEAGRSQTENNVDTARVNAALASTDPATALNVFQDGPGGSDALLQSLVLTPVVQRYRARATQVSAFARGPLFYLPAGSVDIVVGGEARKESLFFNNGAVDADRKTEAAFFELRAPLIGEAQSIPLVRRLTLTTAGRYDHYSDFGGTYNQQYGVEWQVAAPFLLRGTHGTSFRAPSLFELFSPRSNSTGLVTDPRRGNAQTAVTIISGGNPDLGPEKARSTSVGFVIASKAKPAARLSVNYYHIVQNRRAVGFSQLVILANESAFASRVTRATPTPADIAAGFPGAIQTIDISATNFGKLKTSGFDFDLSGFFKTPIGSFSPRITATLVTKFETVDLPGSAPVDRVGVANPQGTIPKLRANAALDYSNGPVNLTATGRYTKGYADVNTGGVRTGRHIPDVWLFDAQAMLDLGQSAPGSSWLRGLSLRAGVINLFDKKPPFSAVSGLGFDTSLADNRGRFGYLALSKKF